MHGRPIIDVSKLPGSAVDHRSLVWWGNVLLMAIETTMFALLLAAYFYLRPKFNPWPPPLVDGPIGVLDAVPLLGWPALSLVALLATLGPMIWTDLACLQMNRRKVEIALGIFLLMAVGCIALRFAEFSSLRFRWDDNAYGSVIWTIVGLHLLHLIVGVCEGVVMITWVRKRGLDEKHARDIRVTGLYWYWIVGTWLVLFPIIYLGPRFF